MPFLTVVALGALTGCAGPVETRFGLSGVSWGKLTEVGILEDPPTEGPFAVQSADRVLVREAVLAAMARRGIGVTANAPVQVEIAISDRDAASGVAGEKGASLSPAKRKRLLQSCDNKIYRLSLSGYRPALDGVKISHAWAEETHCRATLRESLPALADAAIRAMLQNIAQGESLRCGRD